jgi:hypothetical protein
MPVGIELPFLAREPAQQAALDGAEVGADENVARTRAQCRSRKLRGDTERIAVARELGAIAGDQGIDQMDRVFGIIAA